MSERSGELRNQCANYALPSLPTYPSLPEENYSPSTPPSSTSTRDTATLDGWTTTILLALAGYLESVGQALSDVPGHLRWLADGTDLVGLLGLEQPSSPVAAAGPPGPVGRSVGEIRADLAHCDRDGVPWPEAARRLLADVPGLLAEVEAAHRFELAAGVEREALLAEVERLRGVVQAVREWAHTNHGGRMTPAEVWPGLAALLAGPALAAAADAPQPEPERCSATHQRYGRCDLRAGHDGRHTSDIGADGPDDPGYTWTLHGSVAFRNGPRTPS